MATQVSIPTPQGDTGTFTRDPKIGCTDTSIAVTLSGEDVNVSAKTAINAVIAALKTAIGTGATGVTDTAGIKSAIQAMTDIVA